MRLLLIGGDTDVVRLEKMCVNFMLVTSLVIFSLPNLKLLRAIVRLALKHRFNAERVSHSSFSCWNAIGIQDSFDVG